MTSSDENVTTTPEPETIEAQIIKPSPDGLHPGPGARGRIAILVAVAAFAALAFLIYSGIYSRAAAESRLKQRTEEAAIPTVAVVFPKEGAPTQEIVLPGNTRAFSHAPIYVEIPMFEVAIGSRIDRCVAECPRITRQDNFLCGGAFAGKDYRDCGYRGLL